MPTLTNDPCFSRSDSNTYPWIVKGCLYKKTQARKVSATMRAREKAVGTIFTFTFTLSPLITNHTDISATIIAPWNAGTRKLQ